MARPAREDATEDPDSLAAMMTIKTDKDKGLLELGETNILMYSNLREAARGGLTCREIWIRLT